jgi:hypothetical protein
MTFEAIQRYSDHRQVNRVDESADGQAEPAHPAPVLKLAAPSPEGAAAAGATVTAAPASAGGSVTSGALAGAYLVAAIGVLIGLAGVAMAVNGRRRNDRRHAPDRESTPVGG